MLLVTISGWIVWAAFFLMSHFGPRAAPVAIRPAIRWIAAGSMFVYASGTVSLVAHQHDWTRIHRTVGVVELALAAAGLICTGVGLFKVRRRSRVDREQATASIG
jgi:hypothetical protein